MKNERFEAANPTPRFEPKGKPDKNILWEAIYGNWYKSKEKA